MASFTCKLGGRFAWYVSASSTHSSSAFRAETVKPPDKKGSDSMALVDAAALFSLTTRVPSAWMVTLRDVHGVVCVVYASTTPGGASLVASAHVCDK